MSCTNRAPVIDTGHRPDRLPVAIDLSNQVPKSLAVKRRGDLLDQLAELGQHANIKPTATQVQTSVQHRSSLLRRAMRWQRSTIAYRDPWSAPAIRMAGPRGAIRARLTRAVRHRAPTTLRQHSPPRGDPGRLHRISEAVISGGQDRCFLPSAPRRRSSLSSGEPSCCGSRTSPSWGGRVTLREDRGWNAGSGCARGLSSCASILPSPFEHVSERSGASGERLRSCG
jgi:hypothetical protein